MTFPLKVKSESKVYVGVERGKDSCCGRPGQDN